MAVISDVRREWCLTGRYARRSMRTPITAQAAIAPSVTRMAPGMDGFASMFNAFAMKYPAKAPSM